MAGLTKRQQINKKISAAVSKKNKITLGKLEEAFAIDATVVEACFYAGIHPDTYYDWVKKDPKLSDRFEALRNRPVLLARQTVATKLKESYGNAMDYLSRKRKDEFSQRNEFGGPDGGPIEISHTLETSINKVYGKNTGKKRV